MMLRMSLFSRSLMKRINYRSRGFYDPEHRSAKTNGIIVAIFCVLLGGAFWISLTDTLDQQQKLHCEQGWQAACESLK
tara:strand:- start:1070 stop:1303 length:234 start_codon:yes stop_codon:yes gene_type:complete